MKTKFKKMLDKFAKICVHGNKYEIRVAKKDLLNEFRKHEYKDANGLRSSDVQF